MRQTLAPFPQFIELLLSVTTPRPITCTRTVVVVAAACPTAPPTPSVSAASATRLHAAALAAIPAVQLSLARPKARRGCDRLLPSAHETWRGRGRGGQRGLKDMRPRGRVDGERRAA